MPQPISKARTEVNDAVSRHIPVHSAIWAGNH